MTMANLFWMIYIVALLFGLWLNYEAGQPVWVRRAGAYVALWVLVGILGWRVFGSAVRN
jgi:hypothetical protein